MTSLESWRGYAFDRPRSARWESVYPGAELNLRRLLWARFLSQIDKRPKAPGLAALEHSALWDSRTCGWGAGLVRECQDAGHRYFTPLGCGSKWCLRCAGFAADMRAMRVHRDLRELSNLAAKISKVQPAALRIQLTLNPESRDRIIEEGRAGANRLIQDGRKAIIEASGSNGSLPLMMTIHPTSSKRPWIQNPHLHAVALWADMDENGAAPLSWANEKGPLDIEALRESWGNSYEGSSVVHASYFTADENGLYSRPPSRGKRSRQSLASALRYDLRPFQEDVWAALADRRLGVPGGSMLELLNPWRKPTLRCEGDVPDSELPQRLTQDGGVLMWPRFHRVRRYGALASRGYSRRVESLHRLAGTNLEDRTPICDCPECGSILRVVMEEGEVERWGEDGEVETHSARWPRLIPRSEALDEWLELLPAPGLIRESVEAMI